MKLPTLFILVACIALLSACSSQNAQPETVPAQTADTAADQPVVDAKEAALQQISLLSSKAYAQTLTIDDFSSLESLLSGNDEAEHEVEEIKLLISYKEFMHAAHGLAFLDGSVRTGKHALCPAHALAHFYVFAKHGEDEIADEAFEEAEHQLERWRPLAKEYDEKFPGTVSYEDINARITSHMESIEEGERSATEEEIDFLANEGSLCVEDTEDEHDEEAEGEEEDH
jgi:hypothetical protein